LDFDAVIQNDNFEKYEFQNIKEIQDFNEDFMTNNKAINLTNFFKDINENY